MAIKLVQVQQILVDMHITPTRPIPEGNVTAKAYNHSDESKVSNLQLTQFHLQHL